MSSQLNGPENFLGNMLQHFIPVTVKIPAFVTFIWNFLCFTLSLVHPVCPVTGNQ